MTHLTYTDNFILTAEQALANANTDAYVDKTMETTIDSEVSISISMPLSLSTQELNPLVEQKNNRNEQNQQHKNESIKMEIIDNDLE